MFVPIANAVDFCENVINLRSLYGWSAFGEDDFSKFM